MWLGATATNVGGTHINVTTLTAGTGISLTRDTVSVPNTLTIANSGSMTDLHTARFIVSAGGSTDGANYTTIALALAAAISAGGNQTIFLQPGTYTENFTLPANINLSAYSCDATTPNVSIVGTITCSDAGTRSISGIRLTTNSAAVISVTGTVATVVNLINCFINATNNTAITNSSSNTSTRINLIFSFGNLATTGIAYFAIQRGNILIRNSYLNNTGSSVTASTCTNDSSVDIVNSTFRNSITSSNTSSVGCVLTDFFGADSATFTINGTGTSEFSLCRFESGTASAISIGSGAICEVQNCILNSSNANVITGAGTVKFSNLTFAGTSSNINTTTQISQVSSNNAVRVTDPGAYPYTVLTQDALVIVDTSSARTINLPAAPTSGETHIIKDNVGSAASNAITLSGNGKNIDGSASTTINSNYQSLQVTYNGTQWNTV